MGKVQHGGRSAKVNLTGGIKLFWWEPSWRLGTLTHRLGLELGVDLVQAGVEAPEGADVLLIIPAHLVGVTLCIRRERTGGSVYVELFETVGFKGGLVGSQFRESMESGIAC